MVKLSSKTLALVVNAIKNMHESKGSTSRDILNYISSVHDIPQDVAKRQMVAALKRGVAHGIIKKTDHYYSLPTDTELECMEVAAQELGLLDLCCRKKKREARKSKGCKSAAAPKRKRRSSRKSKRMKGCKTRRRKSRSKKRKSKRGCGCAGKSKKRRSKRSKSGCRPKRKSRRSKRNKCDEKALEDENKGKCRSVQLNVNAFDENERESHVRRNSRPRSSSRARSKSRSRSRSRNRNVVPTA